MFLHFSIKFTDKDEKFLGIATEFPRYAWSFCLFDKNLSKLLDFTTLLKYLVWRKDVTRIDKIAQVIQQSFFFLQWLKTSTYYVLIITSSWNVFMYYVLIITSSWNVLVKTRRNKMTWRETFR
jgi:cytochrome c oxidase subunit IV